MYIWVYTYIWTYRYTYMGIQTHAYSDFVGMCINGPKTSSLF